MDRTSLPIFLSVPFAAVNGITTYSIYLARALARLGYPARILLTEADTTLASYNERTLAIPADVQVERLPVGRIDGWGAHWSTLIRVLHEHAPCVYIPNSDFRHSVVSPALRSDVLIVGVAHADEPLHYDHVARLGRYWNAIVCVSREVAEQLRKLHPELERRLVVIRNGIEMPSTYPAARSFEGPLRLVYHGSFKQQQKRILHFPALLRAIRARGIDAGLTLIGSGPDENALREVGQDLIAEGVLIVEPPVPNEVLRHRLQDFHVYVLNSEFEGMPQALLEAMSRGCVPIVTNVSSGTREVVRDGENGYLVQVSDFEAFGEHVATLDADRARLGRMSRRAYDTLNELGFRIEDMARAYDQLFTTLFKARESFDRTPGPITSPPVRVGGLSVFPEPLLAQDPGYGRFPSWGDVEDFRWELSGRRHEVLERQRERPLLFALRHLGNSYESEFVTELAQALREQGYDVRLLGLRPAGPKTPCVPTEVPTQTACQHRFIGWAGASAQMLELVKSHGPCTYVAFDRDTACLAPQLPPSVRTVVLATGSDVDWLRASNLPQHVDGLVFASFEPEPSLFSDRPPPSLRLYRIPYPVYSLPSPTECDKNGKITILGYLGHLDGLAPDWQTAYRVLEALTHIQARVRFVLASPPDQVGEAMRVLRRTDMRQLEVEVVEVRSRRDLHPHFKAAHLLLLPLPLQGASLAVMDALGHGCIPVAVRSSGLQEVVPPKLAVGLVSERDPYGLSYGLSQKILELTRSRDHLRDLAEQALSLTRARYPTPADISNRWIRLLGIVWDASERFVAPRFPGLLFPPYVDLADPEYQQKLVHIDNVGSFAHWYEWVEFKTQARLPRSFARAIAFWEKRMARR